MNTSPITSYEGADEIFTFGANSAGVWIFLIVGVALFVGLLVRAARHESRSVASLRAPAPAPAVPEAAEPRPARMEPMPAVE